MMMGFLTISRFCFCAMDVYMLYRFFKSMFLFRTEKDKRMIGGLTVTLLIFLVNSLGSANLNLICVPILYLAFIMLVFHISWNNGIVYTTIFYAVFAGGKEVAFELLFRLLSCCLHFEIDWFSITGVGFLLFEYLVSFLFLLCIEQYTKKLEVKQNSGFAWYLLILPISSMLILSSFVFMDFPESRTVQWLMCGGAFLLYFSNAAVFIMLEKLTEIMKQIRYEDICDVRQYMQDDKIKDIMALNERYRSYMHETHSYFCNIRVLALRADNDKIVELVDDLEGEMQARVENVIYNKNEILNAILSENQIRAQGRNVELSVFVEKFLDVDFISDIDMISMFSNLLDNAIEAAAKCGAENRKVKVKLFMGNQHMLVLDIENSFAAPVRWNGERIATSKTDNQEQHGLGIGIVEQLAEKYGGTLTLKEDGDLFLTTLIVSNYNGN